MSAPVRERVSYVENYRITIRRILGGFRFSGNIPVSMYAFYADWIQSRNESLWTEEERQYLDLMPELYSSYKLAKKRRGRKKSGDYVRDISSPDYGRGYMVWLYDPETMELMDKFVRMTDAAKELGVGVPTISQAVKNRELLNGYFMLGHKMHLEDFERLREVCNEN